MKIRRILSVLLALTLFCSSGMFQAHAELSGTIAKPIWDERETVIGLSFSDTVITKYYGDTSFDYPVTYQTEMQPYIPQMGTYYSVGYKSSDFRVAEVNEAGTVEIKNAGRTVITAIYFSHPVTVGYFRDKGGLPSDGYTTIYTASYDLTVKKAKQNLSASISSKTIEVGQSAKIKVSNAVGAVNYIANNNAIKVDSNGNVTGLQKGSTSVTVSAAGDANRNGARTTITLNVVPKTPKANTITASNITKTVSSKAQSISINAKCKGGAKLSYKSDNKSVKVDSKGKVTIEKNFTGKATITITSSATQDYISTSKKITVTVNPAKPAFSKVTSPKKGWLKATWKKVSSISGYQIQVSETSSFDSAKSKSFNVASSKKSWTLEKLANKKKYYVRFRTYKTVGKNKLYSKWSTVKNITIK